MFPSIWAIFMRTPGDEWSLWTTPKSADDAEKTLATLRRCNPTREWEARECRAFEPRRAAIFVDGEHVGDHEVMALTVLPEGGALSAFLRSEG